MHKLKNLFTRNTVSLYLFPTTEHKNKMWSKDNSKALVKKRVKQAVRASAKARGFEEVQCPQLMSVHHIYIQTRKEKRLQLTIGGHAYLLPNTSLVIKCPVRRFPKAYIRWLKDGHPLPSSKRQGITKSSSLKVHFLQAEDIGVYKCIAGTVSDILTLQLIGSDSSTGGPSIASPQQEGMLASCHRHQLTWPGVSVSLLPQDVHDVSLHPWVEERLVNITLQADKGEIQQEQASELISSLLTHMSATHLWIRPTRKLGQAAGNPKNHHVI